MKEAGIGLIGLGVLAILAGFLVNVSRSVGYPVGEVANLNAMHIQALVFQGGFFAFLSGVVLFAAGVVNESIRSGSGPGKEEAAPAPVAPPAPEEAEAATDGSGPWVIILVGAGLLMLVILGAIAATAPRSPVSIVDNIAELNVEADMNEPLPAEMPADMNMPLPVANMAAPR